MGWRIKGPTKISAVFRPRVNLSKSKILLMPQCCHCVDKHVYNVVINHTSIINQRLSLLVAILKNKM